MKTKSFSILVITLLSSLVTIANAGPIEWVTVGNPANIEELSGPGAGASGPANAPNRFCGAVDYIYRIAKYEVTNSQYCEFLNAVAATDTYSLYNTNMDSGSPDFGGITRSGSSGSYSYSTKSGRGNCPVAYVSFYDTLRFANWLHNGQPSGIQDDSTTEDGAYDMDGDISTHKPGALFWLPTEDEWYKAAYYDPSLNSGAGGYWDYSTRSNTVPDNNWPLNDTGNSANWNHFDESPYLTDVGAYGLSVSAYGTFDQTGNLWEWTEAVIGSERGLRGGSFGVIADYWLPAYKRTSHTPGDELDYGFRIASNILRVEATSSTPVQSTITLEQCQWYQIEARGTYVWWGTEQRHADAEWYEAPSTTEPPYIPGEWYEDTPNPSGMGILDLLINETHYDWMGTTDGVSFSHHLYSPSHVYRLYYMGQGQPIDFRIYDNSPGDNSGYLDVIITPFTGVELHVDCVNGNDDNDGFTRERAFATIQKGIQTAACAGDTVLVWPGVYEEDISFLGKAITVRSAADAAHIVADGLYAVSFINGEDNGSVLENFVIRDSNTGIQCVASDPTIRFVTVANCDQGIWADQGANPDISNSILWDNATADLINTTASWSWIMDEKYQGMVGYWRFDEGSGSSAKDSSSNGNDGTVTGASWTTGQIDGALNFDGDDDYVEVADDGSLSGMSQLTVGCWFKAEYWYADSNLSVIVSKAYQGDGLYTTDCYQISNFIYNGKYTFACGIYGGGSECDFHAVIDDVVPDFDPYAWHHVALTYDSSAGQVKVYLDGQPIHTESCSIGTLHNNTTAKLRIGNFDGTSANYQPFEGDIDEVVIYARKLSPEEIQYLYEIGDDGKVMDDPLFADPAGSDYHLPSERGRYQPVDPNHPVEGYWVLDEVTSPCIDAGDPSIDASEEPSPNGEIVNIGAYGGTGYASRSMAAERRGLWSLVGDLNYDGIVNLLDMGIMAENWLKTKEE